MIATKFGEQWGGWTLGSGRVPHGCSLWWGIRMSWGTLQQYVYFEIGDDTQLRFSNDVWCGSQSLKELYPD